MKTDYSENLTEINSIESLYLYTNLCKKKFNISTNIIKYILIKSLKKCRKK